MDFGSPLLWVSLALLGGSVGAAIGSHKGRSVAGFWFGLFLGVLGWFIVAIGPNLRRDSAHTQK